MDSEAAPRRPGGRLVSFAYSSEAWRTGAIVVGLVTCYGLYAAALSLFLHFDLPPLTEWLAVLGRYVAAVFLFYGVRLFYGIARHRPESPFSYARARALEWRLPERFISVIPVLIALGAFLGFFGAAKSSIGMVNTYTADPMLAVIDARLHSGDAWRLIQPLLGYPVVSHAINIGYHLWAGVLMVMTIFTVAYIDRPRLRLQYLITFLLCWIVMGTVLATAIPSVGPCYYEYFYGDARFRPLMEYLRQANQLVSLPALDVQNQLLDWYKAGEHGRGRGISAMPSMHVSMACLFALFGWRISRFWGVAATIFLAVILIGSVHLGYHYAIDGYVSLLLTPLLWWGSGKIAHFALATSADAQAADA